MRKSKNSYICKVYCYLGIMLGMQFLLISCQPSTEKQKEKSKAQHVIDNTIETHGGGLFDNMALSFDFRDRHYTAFRKDGQYVYTREFTDSTDQIKDVLGNDGFYREVNGQKVELPEEKETAYANSVNSVIYFALLPHGLNDDAVNKEYFGETTIKGEPYHKIKITFDPEGGGSDFEDEFLYWIHQTNHTVDYLAYSFHVEEGGLRFREAYNVRDIKGILFSDYNNYEPASDTLTLDELDAAFENSGLKKLSEINLANITLKTENL